MERKIDSLGRIVIPIGIRRNLGWREGTPCEVQEHDGKVIINRSETDVRKVKGINELPLENFYQGKCPYCDSEVTELFNKLYCGNCSCKIDWERE